MKKIVLLITAICLTSETFGQKTSSSSVDEYECIYEYQMKNDKGSSDATSTILQIGRNSAMFSDYTAFQADSAIACKAPESEIQKFKTREKRNDLLFDQSVSQNVPKGKLTVYSVITPNYYSYTESANPINWNLTEGIDTVTPVRKLLENMVEELGLFGIPRRYQHPLDHGNFVVCQAWYWQQRIQKAYISSML